MSLVLHCLTSQVTHAKQRLCGWTLDIQSKVSENPRPRDKEQRFVGIYFYIQLDVCREFAYMVCIGNQQTLQPRTANSFSCFCSPVESHFESPKRHDYSIGLLVSKDSLCMYF